MPDEIIIITPEIEPGGGGLADYTLRVIEQWRGIDSIRFLLPTRPEDDAPASRPRVEAFERTSAALLAKLPLSGGRVLLQYSAYGFDRFGYPRWLLRALGDWRQRSGGILVVMLHEIWGFWPVLNKNYLIQQLHRRDLRALIRRADSVVTSTASQAEHLHTLCPESAVQVLPVGTNIVPRSRARDEQRDTAAAILFGLEGSRIHALQKMHADLKAVANAGCIQKLITAGGGTSTDGLEQEMELLKTLGLARGFEQRGPLSEEEVSQLLSQSSFGLSAQDELSVTKSGTFMAYAAHGLNILSPFAHPSASEPLHWATAPVELAKGISDEQLRSRAESLRAWQERTCSWPRIAERFAHALRLDV